MSIKQRQAQDHQYLVCAIYRDKTPSINGLTKVEHVAIVVTSSPLSAINISKKGHDPGEDKPNKYVASRILGTFQTVPSGRTYTCEELFSE